jgi:very-short-patch-repair endonuclease
MSFGVVFLVLAIGFLGLIVLPKLLPKRSPKEPVKVNTVEPDPPAVRGDELAIWPFAPMPIMTDTEVVFFNKLKVALPEYHIFVQVQLSRIITANSEEASERSFWFNRICRQSVDYVLVDIDAQTTLVAIELDDWTHGSKARQKADDKKDKALASAGIPIVRFHAERLPNAEMLRYELLQVINTY